MSPEEELAQLKVHVATQAQRLQYALMQLDREAKFLPKWKPENNRFHRAHEVIAEVHASLAGTQPPTQGGQWNNHPRRTSP